MASLGRRLASNGGVRAPGGKAPSLFDDPLVKRGTDHKRITGKGSRAGLTGISVHVGNREYHVYYGPDGKRLQVKMRTPQEQKTIRLARAVNGTRDGLPKRAVLPNSALQSAMRRGRRQGGGTRFSSSG